MNMKNLYILWIACTLLMLPSCKKDTWLDWKAQNKAWIANNPNTNDSIQVTPTGLQYKVIRQGIAGTKPDALKTIDIKFTGRLITGHTFVEESAIASYQVAELIDGLQEGVKKMNKSGIYEFYIPAELGYGGDAQGERGMQNYIPPFSTLIFRVELYDVY